MHLLDTRDTIIPQEKKTVITIQKIKTKNKGSCSKPNTTTQANYITNHKLKLLKRKQHKHNNHKINTDFGYEVKIL